MTCREKLKSECPEAVDSVYTGGCESCPDRYGYLGEPEYCQDKSIPREERCTRCWDREIPETPTENKTINEQRAEEGLPPIVEPHILDSGNRTAFESGAVRDMREGKGRCDLMPLAVAARMFSENPHVEDPVIRDIDYFNDTRNTDYLYRALVNFCHRQYSGFVPTMLLEVAKHFEEGAKKYGENNWQKGIPVHCYIDSAVRHYIKWHRGDTDEPHHRAFVWNLMCCIWEVDYHKTTVEGE